MRRRTTGDSTMSEPRLSCCAAAGAGALSLELQLRGSPHRRGGGGEEPASVANARALAGRALALAEGVLLRGGAAARH